MQTCVGEDGVAPWWWGWRWGCGGGTVVVVGGGGSSDGGSGRGVLLINGNPAKLMAFHIYAGWL